MAVTRYLIRGSFQVILENCLEVSSVYKFVCHIVPPQSGHLLILKPKVHKLWRCSALGSGLPGYHCHTLTVLTECHLQWNLEATRQQCVCLCVRDKLLFCKYKIGSFIVYANKNIVSIYYCFINKINALYYILTVHKGWYESCFKGLIYKYLLYNGNVCSSPFQPSFINFLHTVIPNTWPTQIQPT